MRNLKKILTLVVSTIFCTVSGSFAQVSNFYNIGIGINAGVTHPYTDLNYKEGLPIYSNNVKELENSISASFGGSIDYYFTPFVNMGLEYNQVGLRQNQDHHGRQYDATFSSIEFRLGASLGQFLNYGHYGYNDALYALRGLNMSIGYAIISGTNNVGDFDKSNDPEYRKKFEYFRKHANDLGKSEFKGVSAIPVTIGYNFIFNNQYNEQVFLLGLNLKTVFTNSDNINGYNDDPAIYDNKAKDSYAVFGISLKYLFGTKNIY